MGVDVGLGQQDAQMRGPRHLVEHVQHALGHRLGGILDAADGFGQAIEEVVDRGDRRCPHQRVGGRVVAVHGLADDAE